MTTPIIILSGLLLVAAIVVADLKALKWIENGGLKSSRHHFLLIYLPVAIWFFCIIAPAVMDAPGIERHLRLLSKFLGMVYGIGFTLHYFRNVSLYDNYWDIPGFTRSAAIGLPMLCMSALSVTESIRINDTPSMPRGVYTLAPVEDRPLRGDLASFCLESDNPFVAIAVERGYGGEGGCPTGLSPFLKVLAGVSGDTVEISPDGIILNGAFLAGTARPEKDSRGREMPPSLLQNGKIPEGRALVLSQEHGNSFDSRHFGLVPYSSLTAAEPLLIFREGEKHGQDKQ